MAKSPLLLGQRHPRYSLTFFAFVLCAWWFLSHRSPPPRPVFYTHNDDLKGRLEREERKYRAMLPERQALIKKFGPTPAQVVMYVARPSIINAGVVVDNRHVSGFLRMSNHGPRTPSVCRESSVSEFTLTRSAGDFFPPIFNCPHELDRIGALSDGGKWMCGISRIQDKPDCVIYSFGMSHILFPFVLRPRVDARCQVHRFAHASRVAPSAPLPVVAMSPELRLSQTPHFTTRGDAYVILSSGAWTETHSHSVTQVARFTPDAHDVARVTMSKSSSTSVLAPSRVFAT